MMNDLYIYKISVLCSFQCSFLNLLVFFVPAFVAASSIRYSRTQIRSVYWCAPRLTRKILRNNIYTLEDFVRIFSSANFIKLTLAYTSVKAFLIYFQVYFNPKNKFFKAGSIKCHSHAFNIFCFIRLNHVFSSVLLTFVAVSLFILPKQIRSVNSFCRFLVKNFQILIYLSSLVIKLYKFSPNFQTSVCIPANLWVISTSQQLH